MTTPVPLPSWNTAGLLDEGVHSTDLDGIWDRFVVDAPNTSVREQLFGCLQIYLDRVRKYVGPSRVWIDGGFAMRKPQPPSDVDLVILPDDGAILSNLDEQHYLEFFQFLTLQEVMVWNPWPATLKRLQPVAGTIDAFISRPEDEAFWRDFWSKVKRDGVPVDERKGFAEVRI